MDYSDLARQARMDHILRERVALGGCGDGYYGFGDDYSDYMGMGGVYVGGKGPSVKSKMAAANNNWLRYKRQWIAGHDVKGFKGADITKAAAADYRAQGKPRVGLDWSSERAPAYRQSPAFSVPSLSLSSVQPRAQLRRGAKKIGKRGAARRRFISPNAGIARPLTAKEMNRVNKRYSKKNKIGSCVMYDANGNYFLQPDYHCVDYKKKNLL